MQSTDYFSIELKKQVVGVTGFILTKLDGTARGGCVV
jgi:signal recognition particle GTPase